MVLDSISKPDLCNKKEIGLNDFIWSPYRIKFLVQDINLKRIGIHFIGNTNQKNKSLTVSSAEKLWMNIKNNGFNPYEIHNDKYNTYGSIDFNFIEKHETLRYSDPTIQNIIQEISKCDYFIGIDSGILYLAISILGPERCIGIEKNYNISKYAPININKLRIGGSNDLWENLEELKNFIRVR
jgi:hypothetical protein